MGIKALSVLSMFVWMPNTAPNACSRAVPST